SPRCASCSASGTSSAASVKCSTRPPSGGPGMRPETALAAEVFRLRVPRRTLQGRIGDRAGRGIGSSIEFEDWRDYQPGDDLRHVDWRGYARTDVLKVRLYREEVAPVLDVVLDVSRSMAVTPRKARA